MMPQSTNKPTAKNQAIEQISTERKLVHQISSKDIVEKLWVLPLSHSQKRLWYMCQLPNISTSYNLIQEFHLTGQLEISTLEFSIIELIRKYPGLRTTFKSKGDDVVKIIHEEMVFKISFEDLTKLSIEKKNEKVKQISAQIAGHNFDLEHGPLIKVVVIWLSSQEYHLIINMHHIIADGISFELLKQDISTYYNARINYQSIEFKALDLPTEEATNEIQIKEHQQYWKQKLTNCPELLELNCNKIRPVVQSFNGKRIYFSINGKLAEDFSKLCSELGISNYVGYLTAFNILIHKYTGKDDIIIGSPFSGRKNSQRADQIDFLVNTVPLRTTLDKKENFAALAKKEKKTVREAIDHQHLSFDQLVETINPHRSSSYSPIFQVMLAYQNYAKTDFSLQGLSVRSAEREIINAKFDLTLEIIESENPEVKAAFDFNTDIYKEADIQRLSKHFTCLLERIVNAPQTSIANIPLVTNEEYQLMVYEWNQTAAPYPKEKCLHHLFEETVTQNPFAPAVIFEDKSLTYDELNRKSNQLARLLISLGVGKEDFVGIQIDRSFEMIISVLAVLKAGAAYLAIDPEYPEARKAFMLQEAEVKVMLSTSNYGNNLSPFGLKTILLDQDHGHLISRQSEENPNIQVAPNDLAYMIYTSGSTGQPKGVLIEHKGIPNLVIDHIRKYELKPGNCVLQFASLSFDASICEIGMTLLSGASLCIARKDDILPGPRLIRLLNQKKISHVTLPPSALTILPDTELPHLKVITVTGEACPEILVDKWSDGRKFFNGYGPSEVTVGATISDFKKGSKKTSIGKPFANYQVYILDQDFHPVPVGMTGEIYIGGIGLARGYHNNDETTQQKFIDNPFDEGITKIYRTGDLGKFLPNGEIDFIGRTDNLIKLRGMRIELGEIETVINSIEGVTQSKVIVRGETPMTQKIVAYFTSTADYYLTEEVVKSRLLKKLPKHMVPCLLLRVNSFPKLPNGKIDTKQLPEIEGPDKTDERPFETNNPIEKTLQKIWQELLKTPHISIHDDFFDLGGHSLLAVSLVSKIELTLGIEMAVSALLQSPTIAQLAQDIERQGFINRKNDTIVPIKQEGYDLPIYLFHTPSGHVLSYYKLGGHMAANHPVYGIQVDDLKQSNKPYYSLKEMARFYAAKIREHQPQGPYHLGGYCFGGLVAFEVANELSSQGQKVGHVILIGSKFPTKNITEIVVGESEVLPLHDGLQPDVQNQSLLHWDTIKEYAYVLKKRIPKIAWQLAFGYFKMNNKLLPDVLQDYKLIHHEMIKRHYPQIYNGNIVLIQPSNKSEYDHKMSLNNWKKLVNGDILDLKTDGSQAQLLEGPYVERLGKLITRIMENENHINIALPA